MLPLLPIARDGFLRGFGLSVGEIRWGETAVTPNEKNISKNARYRSLKQAVRRDADRSPLEFRANRRLFQSEGKCQLIGLLFESKYFAQKTLF